MSLRNKPTARVAPDEGRGFRKHCASIERRPSPSLPLPAGEGRPDIPPRHRPPGPLRKDCGRGMSLQVKINNTVDDTRLLI